MVAGQWVSRWARTRVVELGDDGGGGAVCVCTCFCLFAVLFVGDA